MKMSNEKLSDVITHHNAWHRGISGSHGPIFFGGAPGRRCYQANLRDADLSGMNMNSAILVGMNFRGPELLDIGSFWNCLVPERLLPWLSQHERFARYLPSLHIVTDDIEPRV